MADLLCGTYYPSIDQKGRMSFPTKLRDVLGAEFFLCQGHDDAYIAVYSPQAFQDYCEKLNSIKGKNGSDIRRKLLAGADKRVNDGCTVCRSVIAAEEPILASESQWPDCIFNEIVVDVYASVVDISAQPGQ